MFLFLSQFFTTFVKPISKHEDTARSEFILNVLLMGSMILSLVALAINLMKTLLQRQISVSVGAIFIPLLLFVGCYALSRKGHPRASAYVLLGTFFLFTSYMDYRWGVDLPTALLTYALVIVMAGILINSGFAFFSTAVIAATIVAIQFFQRLGIVIIDAYWRRQPWEVSDSIVTIVMLTLIAVVCWLSNREIEKSLARARRSEAELLQERNALELKVEQRTRELKEAQVEKMQQLYHFAEFGRLSSGLFHDLLNPLNAVSLNLERLKTTHQQATSQGVDPTLERMVSEETTTCMERAMHAAKKLQGLVGSVRKQLVRRENRRWFSANEEITDVMNVLGYPARSASVDLVLFAENDVHLLGDPMKFSQVMLNLISNGIDAYGPYAADDSTNQTREFDHSIRKVTISLEGAQGLAVIRVRDRGVGIPEADLPRIFEPFFTTKTEGHGIGLSSSKRIIEKNFHGSMHVESVQGEGTVFTVSIPFHESSVEHASVSSMDAS